MFARRVFSLRKHEVPEKDTKVSLYESISPYLCKHIL
ncbi:hypothetical protein BACUNI_00384 [Bacteroides uniformis ATCC 8492]|uniref:Transposase n=1 Tax=Bacteroides uniformis (strain ATCC 8492 / DSM 6597 / CCUG 4942 / CIP 103695 / JCM 5828 / KCTC 5204 / NCTC 13054 / VPI 0061) TaxID=411479 RepID=A0ABC9NGT5_BACUC|nr:hypothetical protein BACUNI_00384 [Bacteroides uniformis ATCC 8492]